MDHTFVHFEIPALDVEKSIKFYSGLFGWKVEKTANMEYWSVFTVPVDDKGVPIRPGLSGGMYKKEKTEQQIINYVNVESVDEYSKKVVALGGQIIMPKMEIPMIGLVWVGSGS